MEKYIGDIIFWSFFIVLAALFIFHPSNAVQLMQGTGQAYTSTETGLIAAVK